jgi:hypothetical protein
MVRYALALLGQRSADRRSCLASMSYDFQLALDSGSDQFVGTKASEVEIPPEVLDRTERRRGRRPGALADHAA